MMDKIQYNRSLIKRKDEVNNLSREVVTDFVNGSGKR